MKNSGWWKDVLWGIGLCVVAGVLFHELTAFEEKGGTIRLPKALLLLYKIGGRWLASGLLGGVGAILLVLGIRDAVRGGTPEDESGQPAPEQQAIENPESE